MSKIIFVVMLVAILWSGYEALKPLPDAMAYAALWDAGTPPDTFSRRAGLESMTTEWIQECRAMWMADKSQ